MNLKIERVKRGISQTKLSQISNVGLTTIVKIEKGDIDNIKVGTLRKISKALGVPVTELFFSDEQ